MVIVLGKLPLRRKRGDFRTIAHLPAAGLLIGYSTIIVCFVVVTAFGVEGRPPAVVASNAEGVGLGTGLITFIMRIKIEADPQGSIRFVNFLVVRTVYFNDIAKIGSDHGLYLILKNGQRVNSVALGQSTIGEIFRYRRAGRVKTKIETLASTVKDGNGIYFSTMTRLRYELIFDLVLCEALFVLLAKLVSS